MDGFSHISVDLDAVHHDRSRSPTIYLPSTASLRRASTYYPTKDLDLCEDANLDPFYLEHSLPATAPWEPTGGRHEGLNDSSQHLMTPGATDPDISSSTDEQYMTCQYHNSTLELDRNRERPVRNPQFHSEESFGSSQPESIPALSPSSSFSSTYSPSIYHEPTFKPTEQLFLHLKPTNITETDQFSLHPCTPPVEYDAASQSFTPASTNPTQPCFATPGTMYERRNGYSNRGKPLPSLPNLAHSNKNMDRKGINNTRRPLEPSMISPPSLINPVTLEPHTSHFDRAFFIPATDVPSPVPSPTFAPPPPIRENDMFPERSVWESDSDDESIGRKSLSRRPMDTLRKVRSRAKLRVAKSATKLRPDEQNVEDVPSVPDHMKENYRSSTSTPLEARPTRDVFRPSALETMRVVASSTTSLPRPPSRPESRPGSRPGSRKEISQNDPDVDRSTAAGLHARSRRRQHQPEEQSPDEVQVTHHCREKSSSSSFHSMTVDRPPFLRRVWRSLQTLSCHGEIPHNNPGKSF